jgi:hypothetical protein
MHTNEKFSCDINEGEAEAIIDLLKLIAQQTDKLDKIVTNSVLYDDHDMKKVLLTSVDAANNNFRILGSKLYTIGGTDLMQTGFNQVPLNRPISLISLAWEGIGEWKDSTNPNN